MLVHQLELCTPDGHPLQGGYDVVRCQACGTGFADALVPDAYYETYYAEQAKYASEVQTRTENPVPVDSVPDWVQTRFDLAADQIRAVVPDLDSRVLDIGCATGGLLATLAARGYRELRGIDPSPEAAQVAGSRGIRVDTGTFSNLPSGLGRFDCVCLTGVLEHLWDIDGSMAAVLDLLEPDGIVFVTVPDASRYMDPYIAPFEDFGTEHVNHFSPATLDVLASRFGMESVWSGRADAHLAPRSPCAGMAAAWRSNPRSERRPVGLDTGLVSSLELFTERSRRDLADLDARIGVRLGAADRYAVWGFGELTMKLLTLPSLRERTLAAVIDSNPRRQGIKVQGVAVTGPDGLVERDVPVLIGSILSEEAILADYTRRGLPNRFVTLQGS